VPAGRVGDVSDGIALAESLDLEPTVSVGDDFTRQIRHPITYSRTPVQNYSPPPRLGEHSDGIRRWLAQETHA
jgi:crotonobetainyl-CoA:carnitine CoA-transferase CaiB-like acyl-CoA transferase